MRIKITASLLVFAATLLGAAGCSKPVETLIAEGDALMAKGDYRAASIQLKTALEKQPNNARARWLLGELSLALEDGSAAEKEIRRAGELGVVADSVLPALAQTLILQGKVDEVLALEVPANLPPRSQAELAAAKGLAQLGKGDDQAADELTARALSLGPQSKFVVSARARVLIRAKKLDEAEQLLADLQKTYPDDGLVWSLVGDIQDSRGDLPKAEQAYTTAITKRAAFAQDQLKRAFVRLRQENLDGALADAEKLNKVAPNLQPAWYVAGAVHSRKQDFKKAKEVLDRSYQLNNDHLPTLLLLGWSNLATGSPGQAGEQARRALAIAPNVVGARLLMATIDLREQRPDRAEEMARPVVKAFPDNLPAKNLLIASLQAQGKGAEAAPLLTQIADASPESLDVQLQVSLELLRAREPEKALAVLERVVERAPEAPSVNAALVVALMQEKKFDEALAAAERFHQQDPEDVGGLRMLAGAQGAKGDTASAKATLRKALAVAPGDVLSAVVLADLLTREDDLDGARKILEEASSRNPGDAGLMTTLSYIAVRQGRTADAGALLEKAYQANPSHLPTRLLVAQQALAQNAPRRALEVLPTERDVKDRRILNLRAEAYLGLKEYANARDDFERLSALLPAEAQVHLKLASVYDALGDQNRMDKSLEEAARLDPKDPNIGLARARAQAARGKYEDANRTIAALGLAESDAALLETRLYIAQRKGDKAEQLRIAEALFKGRPTTETVFALVRAQAASGATAKAEQTLTDWVAQHPQDEAAALALAQVNAVAGRSGDAAALLRPLVAKRPDNAALLNNLAWYLLETAPAEALSLAERASAAAPDNAAILDTYAMALARNGQFDRALRAIDRAIGKAKDPGFFKLQRIEILESAGDRDRALQELNALRDAGVPEDLRSRLESISRRLGASG